MSAGSRVTDFLFGKERYVLMFCHRCSTGPIILKRQTYDRVAEQHIASALLCIKCSGKKPKR